MSKWSRYRKIELVDMILFEKPSDPSSPTYPIELFPCYCEPQDGRKCSRHQLKPVYEYAYRAIDRWVSIRPGEYLVKLSNGQAMTVNPEELGQRFELAESSR